MNPLSGGPIGAGIRALAPNSQMAQGMTDPFGFQGGGGAGAMFGGGGQANGSFANMARSGVPEPNPMAAVPVQTPMVMQSPMKQQEEEELVMVQADSFENPETGEMVATEDLQIDDSGLIPVVNEQGMYYIMDMDGAKIPVSPDHESIVPRSVVEGVEPGSAMQEAIATYKSGGEQAMGGVGETPMEMRSPAKHNDPKAEKKHGKVEGFFNEKAHKAWHMENNPEWLKTDSGARDFSEHNTSARETEGTIEEQEARKKAKANKPK